MFTNYDELLHSIEDRNIRNEITNKFMELETKIIELEELNRELRDKNIGLNNKNQYKQARINMLEEMIKGVISGRCD